MGATLDGRLIRELAADVEKTDPNLAEDFRHFD
jgi:hypothetical protein